jgi:hypothetical protein
MSNAREAMDRSWTSQWNDILSANAKTVLTEDNGRAYGRLVPKGGGSPAAKAILSKLPPEGVLAVPVTSHDAAAALSGLWLWHDFLDESHTISQGLVTPTGSLWHAIMHRREGDFWNAKYWYARCRHHPALAEIPVHAESVIQQLPGIREVERLTRSGWDADGFVDLVEAVHRDPADPRHAAAVRLQQVEWHVLFDHCLRAAIGR